MLSGLSVPTNELRSNAATQKNALLFIELVNFPTNCAISRDMKQLQQNYYLSH